MTFLSTFFFSTFIKKKVKSPFRPTESQKVFWFSPKNFEVTHKPKNAKTIYIQQATSLRMCYPTRLVFAAVNVHLAACVVVSLNLHSNHLHRQTPSQFQKSCKSNSPNPISFSLALVSCIFPIKSYHRFVSDS